MREIVGFEGFGPLAAGRIVGRWNGFPVMRFTHEEIDELVCNAREENEVNNEKMDIRIEWRGTDLVLVTSDGDEIIPKREDGHYEIGHGLAWSECSRDEILAVEDEETRRRWASRFLRLSGITVLWERTSRFHCAICDDDDVPLLSIGDANYCRIDVLICKGCIQTVRLAAERLLLIEEGGA